MSGAVAPDPGGTSNRGSHGATPLSPGETCLFDTNEPCSVPANARSIFTTLPHVPRFLRPSRPFEAASPLRGSPTTIAGLRFGARLESGERVNFAGSG